MRAALRKSEIITGLVTLKAIRAPYLLLLVLPFVFLAVDGSFLTNRIGDPDTWFYYGHMTAPLGAYRTDPDYVGAVDYYQTRLPFILPGWLLFKIFLPSVARTLHYWLYYATITFSLLYVIKHNLSRITGVVAAALLGTDIFFLRATGWSYVNIGVLCYLALTFVALTVSARSTRPLPWIGLAAFCFTCSVFTHLMSAVLIIPVVGYAWCVLHLERVGWPRFWRMLGAALAGVAACQIVFGTLNVLIWRTGFFFISAQLLVAGRELNAPTQWELTGDLLQAGNWLVIHIAVYLASISMLAAATLHLIRVTRFQVYCFTSVVVLYLLIFALDYFRISEMMARQGLYATFLMFSTYLAVAAIIPSSIPPLGTMFVVALSMISLVVRLRFHGGTDFGIATPAWELGLLIGACLAAAGLIRSRLIAVAGLCGVAALSLSVSWRFERDESVYAAHDAIKLVAGNAMPYFLLDKDDPLWNTTIASVLESFAERAFWMGMSTTLPFPQASPAIKAAGPIKLFVVSSTLSDHATVAGLLASQFSSVKPVAFMRLDRSGASLWVHGFEVTSAAH